MVFLLPTRGDTIPDRWDRRESSVWRLGTHSGARASMHATPSAEREGCRGRVSAISKPADQHGRHVPRSERASRRGRCAPVHRRRRRGDGDAVTHRRTCGIPRRDWSFASARVARRNCGVPCRDRSFTAASLAEAGPLLPLSSPVAAAASLAETGPALSLSATVAPATSCSEDDSALSFSSVAAPTVPGAHVAVGVSASASDAYDFGASLCADALAYVAELYAADGHLPTRAAATGCVHAAISEEEDDGDWVRDEMSTRWVHVLGSVRARETALRMADVRQARDPTTAVRAIRSRAAPTPVRFSSPEESAAYVPFKGVPARGCGPEPFTPRPRVAGAGACDALASVGRSARASVERKETYEAQAQAVQCYMAPQSWGGAYASSSGGAYATPAGAMQTYEAQAQVMQCHMAPQSSGGAYAAPAGAMQTYEAQAQAQALQFHMPSTWSPAWKGGCRRRTAATRPTRTRTLTLLEQRRTLTRQRSARRRAVVRRRSERRRMVILRAI
jgi:hypothetical protein